MSFFFWDPIFAILSAQFGMKRVFGLFGFPSSYLPIRPIRSGSTTGIGRFSLCEPSEKILFFFFCVLRLSCSLSFPFHSSGVVGSSPAVESCTRCLPAPLVVWPEEKTCFFFFFPDRPADSFFSTSEQRVSPLSSLFFTPVHRVQRQSIFLLDQMFEPFCLKQFPRSTGALFCARTEIAAREIFFDRSSFLLRLRWSVVRRRFAS